MIGKNCQELTRLYLLPKFDFLTGQRSRGGFFQRRFSRVVAIPLFSLFHCRRATSDPRKYLGTLNWLVGGGSR